MFSTLCVKYFVEKPLIYQIFEESKAKLISSLYEDNLSDDAKSSIKQYIGKELANSDKIIVGNDLNQIILINSQANFISTEAEPVEVSVMLFYCLKQVEILPQVTLHHGRELASKCLISTSLFKSALDARSKRFGAPSSDFYTNVGKTTLIQEGMVDVAAHFENWNAFLFERFA